MAYSSRRMCCCMINRTAVILFAIFDTIFAIASIVYNSMRLVDAEQFFASGIHAYSSFHNDYIEDYNSGHDKNIVVTYYKCAVAGSVAYLIISSILLHGGLMKSVLSCKIWLITSCALFIASITLYAVLLLESTTVFIIALATGLAYKLWEMLVVSFFVTFFEENTSEEPADFIAIVEYSTPEQNSNTDLEVHSIFSGSYVCTTPTAVGLSSLSFGITNAGAYYNNRVLESGSPSFVYMNNRRNEQTEAADGQFIQVNSKGK